MAGTKASFSAPNGMFAQGGKAREWDEGEGGSARVGYSSMVSFRRPGRASAPRDVAEGEDDGGKGLFVAHARGLMPRDPVARPTLKPRLKGAAKPIFLCEEPPARAVLEPKEPISKTEVDIATFVEAVTAAYPQPRDPDVRPVLQARPKGAALPFVFLPGEPEPVTSKAAPKAAERPAWDAEAMQRAHKERELKAFHEFLDRMESGPLEALDRPLADLDERAEASRQFTAPPALPHALYDPILEEASPGAAVSPAREAPPVPEEDRPLIVKAVIEPLEPVGNPRLPQTAEVLPGGAPQRLSPSQRAHLKRPVTLRDRHGRIAPVTYSMNPRIDSQ